MELLWSPDPQHDLLTVLVWSNRLFHVEYGWENLFIVAVLSLDRTDSNRNLSNNSTHCMPPKTGCKQNNLYGTLRQNHKSVYFTAASALLTTIAGILQIMLQASLFCPPTSCFGPWHPSQRQEMLALIASITAVYQPFSRHSITGVPRERIAYTSGKCLVPKCLPLHFVRITKNIYIIS